MLRDQSEVLAISYEIGDDLKSMACSDSKSVVINSLIHLCMYLLIDLP